MNEELKNTHEYIKLTRGCATFEEENIKMCNHNSCNKLNVNNWLEELRDPNRESNDIVEIRFKNTRKDFFRNESGGKLNLGDLVAVEASPGHDIGIVSLVGELVYLQLRKFNIPTTAAFKKVYRKAKGVDIEKWKNFIFREDNLLQRGREIAVKLNLNMKIGDVEFQGDGTKAVFFYIADERVDFRELIKLYAEEFKIRIEMRQIGARQEAGRIGGIGACGRELCCTTFITNFVSVTTNAARYQELSLNPQKLAGQCGKLKCCLNYELDSYLDAIKDFPDSTVILKLEEGEAYHQKTDVYKGILWYSFHQEISINITPVSVERVKFIIEQNRNNIIPKSLLDDNEIARNNKEKEKKEVVFENDSGKQNITRFESKNTAKKKKKKNKENIQDQTSEKANNSEVNKTEDMDNFEKTDTLTKEIIDKELPFTQQTENNKITEESNLQEVKPENNLPVAKILKKQLHTADNSKNQNTNHQHNKPKIQNPLINQQNKTENPNNKQTNQQNQQHKNQQNQQHKTENPNNKPINQQNQQHKAQQQHLKKQNQLNQQDKELNAEQQDKTEEQQNKVLITPKIKKANQIQDKKDE